MSLLRIGALALLTLVGCSAYQKPDGSFELKSRAQLMGLESQEAEQALVIDPEPVPVRFAPAEDSKPLGHLKYGQQVVVQGHVVKNGEVQDWALVTAEGLEGYVTAAFLDTIVQTGASVPVLPITGDRAGVPVLATTLLERHVQLSDGTLIRRQDAADLDLPSSLQEDARCVFVEGSEAFANYFDRKSRVELAPGTQAVVLGASRYPDDRAVITEFQSPVLIRTGDKLLFVPFGSLLLHPVEMAEGLVGVRSIIRFKASDPYRGRYSRLECWKNGEAVSVGSTLPGEIESLRMAEGVAGAEWVTQRRLSAGTYAPDNEGDPPFAEAVVEDWYHRELGDPEPWGKLTLTLNRSLEFSAWDGPREETYKLALSGLGERFSGKKGELQGSYQLSTWTPAPEAPVEEEASEAPEGEDYEDHGDPGPESPPVTDVSGSLNFGLTAVYEDGYFSFSDSGLSQVEMPEDYRPDSADQLHSWLYAALNRAVGDPSVADQLFPGWFN